MRQDLPNAGNQHVVDRRRPLAGEGVLHFDVAHARDRAAQADEGIAVELIGAPEVVDDLHAGALGLGVPDVVGELVVGDLAAVAVLAAGSAEVHA